jgi:hypothetical protein
VIGSAGGAPAFLILGELGALEGKFVAADSFLRAESEIKHAVWIALPPGMARIGHLVKITIGRGVAMIRIGSGRQRRACFTGLT